MKIPCVAAVAAALVIGACGDGGSATIDASANPVDAASPGDTLAPVDAARFDPGPEPTDVIRPIPGEVTLVQLSLPPGITARLGEAGILVGPDGTLVLLDIGNSNHDDEVRAAIRELNTEYLTPARGFPARSPLQVEWIVITHVHGDHVGSFHNLVVDSSDPISLVHGVVHRGFVDLGAGMNTGDYEEFCAGLRGPLAQFSVPLCEGAAEPPCDFASVTHPYVATSCDGLFAGDLSTDADDAARAASYIELGGGARLTLFGANGFVSNGSQAVAIAPFGHDTGDEENGRSVVGLVEHGSFRYYFGGDLHGRASDGPDVESHLVAVAGPAYVGDLGFDVVHAHHHARRTSSNSTFVAAAAPADGRSRNVVAGINAAHLGSPYAEVLAAWGDGARLGDGRIWVTEVTAGGATSPQSIAADGPIVIQTIQRGLGYRIQAAGAALQSAAFASIRAQP